MKTKNMKKVNVNILKVSMLVIFTSLLPMTNVLAQKKQLFYPNSDVPIEVGDSIRINPDSLRYETRERKALWVYDQIHEVRQVSSKYHPDGVLLRGIYSWIYANSILPENVEKKPLYYKPVYTTFEMTINHDESYDWNGTSYSTTGEYVQKLVAHNGADSIVTLKLIVLPEPIVQPQPIYTMYNDTVDYGQTYTWNEVTYDTTGIYTQSFVAINGADSVVTLNLYVKPEPKPQPYQVHRMTIGLRGGIASTVAKPATLPVGYEVLLDLQYAHYWAADKDKIRLGLLTGISAGYMTTNRSQNWDETFVANTSDGDVKYHVTADNIQEINRQVNLEVPVMFSMITNDGIYLNVGPRIMMPVYTPYVQTITNCNIVATDIQTGVVVPNNPVYGYLRDEQAVQKGRAEHQFDLVLSLGLDFGYEFKFKSGNSFGLGVYANYGVFSTYSNRELKPVIAVTAPNNDVIGSVQVESLMNAYTNKIGHLDAGIKLTYNLDFIK